MKRASSRTMMALTLASLLFAAVPATHAKDEAAPVLSEAQLAQARALFKSLPDQVDSTDNPITEVKVALGKKLFYDPRLSQSSKLSCNSCHNLETYGVDNEKTSVGHENQRGSRNSPTVYNAALHISQFWDGRALTIEEQALGPVMNPVEMAMPTEAEAIARLSKDAEYVRMFKEAFPEEQQPLTFLNMGKAIGAFERTLLTPSRFDAFLEGDNNALTAAEQKGLKTFMEVGCTACHSGAALGGHMYQKLGLVKPYPTEDLGRFEVTKNESDKHVFKVPSLRNVEKTYPYFHDGGVATLGEAVRLMATHQLGRELTDEQVKEIVTFLRSLTGEIPTHKIS